MPTTLAAGSSASLRTVVLDELSGALIASRYQLLSVIGAGTGGTVWVAHDHVLCRQVALKQLDAFNAPGRPIAEARAAAILQHPNTVRVYDLLDDGDTGVAWLVMEALSGKTIADVLKSEGPLSGEEACFVAEQVLRGLEALHRRGLVHRDVKPANVQLCSDGRVVLIDFGLAAAPSTVDPVAAVGSLPYMAPELFGEGTYSAASDLYALGMTLYASLGGVPSPLGDLAGDLRSGPVAEFARLPHLARSLKEVIRGLTTPDPRQRLNALQAHNRLDQASAFRRPERLI